jgi:pimeloyl-ACP methyl ester carboxylesterase
VTKIHNKIIKLNNELGIDVQLLGNGDEYALCLHGWLDNSNSFLPLKDYIHKNFTLICIDLPGHGNSKHRSVDAQYYFIEYIADVLNILNILELDRCHFIGHSMGAKIVSLVASLYPNRVKSLTLIEGFGLITTDVSETKEQLRKSLDFRIKLREPKFYKSKENVIKARMSVSDLQYAQAALLMQRNVKTTEHGIVLKTDQRLKAHSGFRFDEEQAKNILHGIDIPTLFIKGKLGLELLNEQVTKFGSCYLEYKTEYVDGGHHCHMEYPEQVSGLIFKHLQCC